MWWATLIIQLIPVIMRLIDIAEKLWIEKGTGKQKKEMVVTATKEIAVAKADQESWDKIEWAVNNIIDVSCMGKFNSKIENDGELLNED